MSPAPTPPSTPRSSRGELSPGERLIEEELAERLGAAAAPCAKRSCGWAMTGSSCASATAARACGGSRSTRRSRSSRRARRWNRWRPATPRCGAPRSEARELAALVDEMQQLHDAGELLAASERNAVMHRRILEISGHRVARDICARLNSQMVRFQFRTVLAPGRRSAHSPSIGGSSPRSPSRDRAGAEAAMREHLTNVAATSLVQRSGGAGAARHGQQRLGDMREMRAHRRLGRLAITGGDRVDDRARARRATSAGGPARARSGTGSGRSAELQARADLLGDGVAARSRGCAGAARRCARTSRAARRRRAARSISAVIVRSSLDLGVACGAAAA